jgi:nucleoside triphosphate pyrophosphatase
MSERESMSDAGPRLVLASGSPRRRLLLETIGLRFAAVPPDIDETPRPDEDPRGYVERLAREKAEAVTASAADLVLAADTTVAFAGEILGKPVDAADARRMLLLLSDQTHEVHTGVAVRNGGRTATRVVTTFVTMVTMADADIAWYVGTGEPLDKAGAYALQGAGGLLVRSVEGSSSNVVGLPLAELAELLAATGWPLDRLRPEPPG